jgi:hypothetical protein
VQHGARVWAAAYSELTNGRDPVETQACPLLTAVPRGYRKARKTNTNPFPQKLDVARRCDANPSDESRVRIAD